MKVNEQATSKENTVGHDKIFLLAGWGALRVLNREITVA